MTRFRRSTPVRLVALFCFCAQIVFSVGHIDGTTGYHSDALISHLFEGGAAEGVRAVNCDHGHSGHGHSDHREDEQDNHDCDLCVLQTASGTLILPQAIDLVEPQTLWAANRFSSFEETPHSGLTFRYLVRGPPSPA